MEESLVLHTYKDAEKADMQREKIQAVEKKKDKTRKERMLARFLLNTHCLILIPFRTSVFPALGRHPEFVKYFHLLLKIA